MKGANLPASSLDGRNTKNFLRSYPAMQGMDRSLNGRYDIRPSLAGNYPSRRGYSFAPRKENFHQHQGRLEPTAVS